MAHFDVDQAPHLTAVLTEPLKLIEKQIIANQQAVEDWFDAQWKKSPAPVYGSVDLRNAGFKLAPIDMNLFPAGFNNLQLNPEFETQSIEAVGQVLQQIKAGAKKVLLIPENHTRNLFYWDNVNSLLNVVTKAGYEVRVGSLLPELTEPAEMSCNDGSIVRIEPIKRKGKHIEIDHFVPEIILLNNDLSSGIPEILVGLDQVITPPAALGWSHRLKSGHFQYYADVSREFAELIQVDPWFLAPLFLQCGEIDFMRGEGQHCLATHVETLLAQIKQKYAEYGIEQQPYIVIKADSGTYGMAIMMVRSVEDVMSLNRKQRTHMSKSKGGQPVRSVIVQEGVYTFETWGADNAVAEPVVYLWGERVVGGFYRVHKERDIDENLNAPGMQFEPLVFPKTCQRPANAEDGCQNRFYTYGVVARLSMLAAAREILDQGKLK